MSLQAKLIEPNSPDWPEALRHGIAKDRFSQIWTIGNLAILENPLLAFFCSNKCPGDVILRTYDLARAWRAAGVTVISGFHSPLEKDCLEILLRGDQLIVICPARGIKNMRIPATWREPLADGRLLILSPFTTRQRRVDAELAERRNRFVTALTNDILVAHAAPESRTERFCAELIAEGKIPCTLDLAANQRLLQLGATSVSIEQWVAG